MKTRQMLPLLILVTIGLYAADNNNTLITQNISQNVIRTCMTKITDQILEPSTSTEKVFRLQQMYNLYLENLESNEENKAFLQKHFPIFRNAIKERNNAIKERNKSLKKNIKNSLKIIKNNPDQKDPLRQEIIETLPKLSPCAETDDFLHSFYREFDRAFELKTVPHNLDEPFISSLKKLIEKEQKGIKCFFYQFSHKELADALIKSSQLNIPVSLIVDKSSAIKQSRKELFTKMHINDIDIRIARTSSTDKNSFYKMHLKGILFEYNGERGRPLLITGSANATQQGLSDIKSKNDELMICNDDSALIRDFEAKYATIEKDATPIMEILIQDKSFIQRATASSQ